MGCLACQQPGLLSNPSNTTTILTQGELVAKHIGVDGILEALGTLGCGRLEGGLCIRWEWCYQ
jgi:hypothetical protein